MHISYQLLKAVDSKCDFEIADDIGVYTKAAIIEVSGSQFAEPNSQDEKMSLLIFFTALYWCA